MHVDNVFLLLFASIMSAKTRKVRALPLSRKLMDFPYDSLQLLHENIAVIDWDKLLSSASPSISLLLNFAFIACKAYAVPEQNEYLKMLNEIEDETIWGYLQPFVDSGVKFCQVILILISVINTIYLFSSSKKYTLLKHPTMVLLFVVLVFNCFYFSQLTSLINRGLSTAPMPD